MVPYIVLAYPKLFMLYALAVNLGLTLFLLFYIRNLVNSARSVSIPEPISLPLWLNFMYPRWLDRLTLKSILNAFASALGLAVVTWMILVIVSIVVLAKVYGP